ncbi:MAG: TadE/TadG family type IV pilus assembly protein [Terracidiphilus sp.]
MKRLSDLPGQIQARMRGFCRAAAPEKVNAQPRTIGDRLRVFLRGGDEGASLVEVALTLPIVLMVMTGIFSVGFAYFNQQELTDGVGAAGQYLSVDRTSTTDPCADAYAKLIAAAPNLAGSKLTLNVTMNSTTYTGTSCSGDENQLVLGSTVTVNATYPCNIGMFGVNFSSSCLLKAQVAEYVY